MTAAAPPPLWPSSLSTATASRQDNARTKMEGHRIDAETVKSESTTFPTDTLGWQAPCSDLAKRGTSGPSKSRTPLPAQASSSHGAKIQRLLPLDLVDLLLNKSGQDPAALHKLVSPRLVISFAFSSIDSPLKLGTFSPEDTLTILQAVKLLGEANRALNLSWKPQFRHVEETSLVASSSRAVEPSSQTRTGVVESWTVQLEWNLVYEAPPVAMHAELVTTKKRFKVWKSGPRTVNLVFASSSGGTAPVPPASAPEPISTSTSTELVTQAALAKAASNQGLQLVALEYSFETLPPPVAFWSFFGSATPLVLQRRAFKLCESILLSGLRLALSSWTALASVVAPQQQAQPSSVLPDPEAVTAPIQLRHHPRHFEPELQAEPATTSTTDVIGTRRRWSVTSSSGGGGGGQVASPSFGTPATQSAAAHLHLERPLAERHLHASAPGSEVAFGHEPPHTHPPRLHHHHHSRQHHHHRHSTDDGSFLSRILSLPRQLLAMLFQILQIIVVDFLALGDVFGKMIEMILTYLQVSTTTTMARIETTKLDEEDEAPEEEAEVPPGSKSSPSTAKQVSFTQPEPSDKPRSSTRYSLPLNPPPSPHLSPIVEASSPPPDNDDEAPELALPLPPLAPHTTPIPIPSGLVIPQAQWQALQLPIPSDADSLALALHEQLAHEAAAQAQQQQQQSERHKRRRSELEFEQEGARALSEEQEEQRREPPHVNPRTCMAHDLVAQEAASRARELDHVERMVERFAPGGPELGEFVEHASEEEEGVAAAAAAEETPTLAEGVQSSSAPTEPRPELRKTSSAPARSEHIPSQQQQQEQQAGGEPSVAIATQLEQRRAGFVPSSSSSTTAAAADSEALLSDRLGLILYEPEPEPEPEPELELESTGEAQQPPVSRAAAAVGAGSGDTSSFFVSKQETGKEEGEGEEGPDLPVTFLSEYAPSPSTTPQPQPPPALVEPTPPPPPAASASHAPAPSTTTLTAPQPPVLKTKKSFDPSERGIGIARAFGQGQGQGQGQAQGPLHPSASPRASPSASPTPTPTPEKGRADPEEATRRIEQEQGPEPEPEPRRAAQATKVGEEGAYEGAHEEEEEEEEVSPP